MSDETVHVWETRSDDGERITVTALEAQAVKAWAEAMIKFSETAPGHDSTIAKGIIGFLGGAMLSSDEDIAKVIAQGRRIQIDHGDRPMMAEPMTEDEGREAAKTAKPNRRFRAW